MRQTVLGVDDDPDFRAAISELLTSAGYQFVGAGSGAEALAHVGSTAIDLAIIDGLLPDTRGDVLIRELRRRGFDGAMIFVSTLLHGRQDDLLEQLKSSLQVSAVSRKPIEPERFLEQVDEALASRSGAVPLRSPGFANEPSSQAEATRERVKRATDEIQKLRVAYGRKILPLFYELLGEVAVGRGKVPLVFVGAERLAHRMAGTAGTYGFVRIGSAMGEIEDLLAVITEAGERVRPLLLRTLDAQLDCVARTIIEELSEKVGPPRKPASLAD
ncbi:MAG: response regulator [Deltaproteobacteria bacterium]|nr:response regulator [Deltaproteobacteria bacterium]